MVYSKLRRFQFEFQMLLENQEVHDENDRILFLRRYKKIFDFIKNINFCWNSAAAFIPVCFSVLIFWSLLLFWVKNTKYIVTPSTIQNETYLSIYLLTIHFSIKLRYCFLFIDTWFCNISLVLCTS